MKRRTYLALTGAIGTTGRAGCRLDTTDTDEDADEERSTGTIVEAELVGSTIEWIAEYPDGWRLSGTVTAGGGNTHITGEGMDQFAEAMIGAEVELVDRSLYEVSKE